MAFFPFSSFRAVAGLTLFLIPGAALAEEGNRKFSYNAYLTQAYGETDGGQVLGLDRDGTFDYRSAAFLARYQLTPNDRFVLQLSHERTGASPLGSTRDDIEIDWAFYEHRFESGFETRLGRVPIPFGIYNEIRDVGSLLEFYRPPVGIYFEGAFSSESVDGLMISKSFFDDSDWSLGVDVYAGTWDRPEYLAPVIYEGEAENAGGVQLWLQTPVEGLQVGLAYQRFDQKDAAVFFRHPDSDRFEISLLSFDLNREKLILRAEGQLIETSFAFTDKAELTAYYGLAGWRFTEKFEVHGLFETSASRFDLGPGLPALKASPQYEDRAISLIYRFNSNFLIRLEAHRYETQTADVALPIGQATIETDFAIASVTLSY